MRKAVIPFSHEGWSVADDRLNNPSACAIAAERLVIVRDKVSSAPQKLGAAGPRWRDVTMTDGAAAISGRTVKILARSDSMMDWLTVMMVFPPNTGTERPELGRGLALAMIDAAIHGIRSLLDGTHIDDPREQDVHAALKALHPKLLGDRSMLQHPSPWMPLGGYHADRIGDGLDLDDRQRHEITAALPRRYRCFAHHSGDDGAVGVRMSPISIRGDAPFDPIASMRALSTLPDRFKEAFSA